MRLTCPSCSAVYEVDPGATGRRGRRVRCSACNTEWFQRAEQVSIADAAAAIDRKAKESRNRPLMRDPAPATSAAPAGERRLTTPQAAPAGAEAERVKSGPAFFAGFLSVLVIMGVLAAIYILRGEISNMAPSLAGPLEVFAQKVGELRAMVESAAGGG